MLGNMGNIIGPYLYPSSEAPQYVPGGSTNSVICVLVALLALGTRIWLQKANKALSKKEQEGQLEGEDERSTGFRYVL